MERYCEADPQPHVQDVLQSVPEVAGGEEIELDSGVGKEDKRVGGVVREEVEAHKRIH